MSAGMRLLVQIAGAALVVGLGASPDALARSERFQQTVPLVFEGVGDSLEGEGGCRSVGPKSIRLSRRESNIRVTDDDSDDGRITAVRNRRRTRARIDLIPDEELCSRSRWRERVNVTYTYRLRFRRVNQCGDFRKTDRLRGFNVGCRTARVLAGRYHRQQYAYRTAGYSCEVYSDGNEAFTIECAAPGRAVVFDFFSDQP